MTNFVRFTIAALLVTVLLLTVGCDKKEELPQKQEKKSALSEKILQPDLKELNTPAPEKFQVKFQTSKGDFVMEVYRNWSPHGADRIYYLVKNGFYDGICFFRVVENFMAQFGYHGDPEVTKIWTDMNIPDDPVKQSNLRGFVSFAMSSQPNSRSTQLFINYKDNSYLDQYGFAPVAKVIQGMEVVDQLYSGYGDSASRGGSGPEQGLIAQQGNEYLKKNFPKLDYIIKASIVSE